MQIEITKNHGLYGGIVAFLIIATGVGLYIRSHYSKPSKTEAPASSAQAEEKEETAPEPAASASAKPGPDTKFTRQCGAMAFIKDCRRPTKDETSKCFDDKSGRAWCCPKDAYRDRKDAEDRAEEGTIQFCTCEYLEAGQKCD